MHTRQPAPLRPRLHARLIQLAAAALLLASTLGAGTVAPASAASPDSLTLTQLATVPATDGPAGSLRFQISLGYHLQSTPQAFLLAFVFENDATTSNQDSSDATPVAAGNGQAMLTVDYLPSNSARSLTLAVGLFKDDKTLLSVVTTTPVGVDTWQGRAAFEAAMTARLAGDYTTAVQQLTAAIAVTPDMGNLYYWRADSLTHLDQEDAAILDYQQALQLMPDDRASRVGLGVAQLWKTDWDSAIATLTPIIEAAGPPDKWTAWALRGRGVARANAGYSASAIADYQAYLNLAPNASDHAEVAGWIADLQSGSGGGG